MATQVNISGVNELDFPSGITASIAAGVATLSGFQTASVASVDLTVQAAAITTTTLYAVPTSGLYQISFYAKITTAAGISSVLGGTNGFQIGYTDPTDSATPTVTVADLITNALSANTTTTAESVICVISAKTGTNITYAYDYTSSGTAMQYKLSIRVEAI